MKAQSAGVLGSLLSLLLLMGARPGERPPEGLPADVSPRALTGVVQRYCQTCHNDQLLSGSLSLQGFDVAAAAEKAETAERMIRKLRAGMMPPPGMPRPAGDTLLALVETLEKVVDKAARANPNPGGRRFQRLNRPEYERAIQSLLALDVNAGAWLPLDTKSNNFDNIADAQALSPTLLEAYLNAATDISRMAVGDVTAPASKKTYTSSLYGSQHEWNHVEGAPYGTRGGLVVEHFFPADAKYVFEIVTNGGKGARYEAIDVSIDGEPVALLEVESGVRVFTDSVFVPAGQRRVSAAFVRKTEGPYDDLFRPLEWSQAARNGGSYGTTSPVHLKDLVVAGPYAATGVSETGSRQRIFTCRPTTPEDERPCAQSIIARLAGEAYRAPPDETDLAGLMSFYDIGAREGFEAGARMALQALLASPQFVFRFEKAPGDVGAGGNYGLADVDLASRLSFFLWGTPPDDELMALAQRERLSNERVLEQQALRMLEDPRSRALATRFAAQWLRLQDLEKVHPEPYWFPDYDAQLADAMRGETEALFDHLVREDRSLLELFTADYTFVNERLARHYGVPNITGTHFQRVAYPDRTRRGIFGHGSVLVQTSMANRTSPVLRGKWVMEVLLGTPPPPPPPGVPDLEQTVGSKDGRFLTTRERMELHRANPTCRSCHQFMDPIGLSLDNFDVTGKWRFRENGMPLDTRGQLYDGTPVSTPGELADALLKRPIPLTRTFTENLMAYALGRRIEYFDLSAVRTIAKDAAAKNYRMSAFILGVVKSDAFRMKRAEDVATDEGGNRQR